MNSAIHRPFENTATVLSALHDATREAGPQVHNNDWLILAALTPPILAAFALTEVGLWTVREIQRQIRLREKRPDSPSLRGTPSPADLLTEWETTPRTLESRLRLGSRLSDLDSTLERTYHRRTLPNGKTVIRARSGGMKGWLSDRRIRIPYSTAMRYKKLAQRLRRILSLNDRLPLEWLIDGLPTDQALPADLAAPYSAVRRHLARILRENHTLAALSRYTEQELGIIRLFTIRKAAPTTHIRSIKHRKSTVFSEISRHHRITVTPERLEGTRQAIHRILSDKTPSSGMSHLRNRLRQWLSTLRESPPAAAVSINRNS